jgi:hypothetical protein
MHVAKLFVTNFSPQWSLDTINDAPTWESFDIPHRSWLDPTTCTDAELKLTKESRIHSPQESITVCSVCLFLIAHATRDRISFVLHDSRDDATLRTTGTGQPSLLINTGGDYHPTAFWLHGPIPSEG